MYYLLGTSHEQLAVFHGRETADPFCSDIGQRAYYYPREYLTYAVDYTGKMEDISRVLTHPDGSKQYRISDHLASLRATVDSGVIETYDYDPWGTPIAQPGGERSRRTYNDREHDRESATYNNGVRQFADEEGRFGAVDKLWDAAPGLSPYVYGNNNPLRYIDPTGLRTTSPVSVPTSTDGSSGNNEAAPAAPPSGVVGPGGGGSIAIDMTGIVAGVATGWLTLTGQYKEAEKDATHQPGYASPEVLRQGSAGVGATGGGAVAAIRMGAKPAGASGKSGSDGKSSSGKQSDKKATKTLPVPQVTDPKLQNIVGDLYKGAKGPNPVGNGSTADAVRNERTTGSPTKGKFHSEKARIYIKALDNWLGRSPNASGHNRLVAESLKLDLRSALGGK